MNQLLLPRFKRLMEPASWRDLSVGQAWGAVSGLCHGFALLILLPAASALATGMPVWGLSFWGWLIALAVIAVLGLSLIHISEPTRLIIRSRMPSSA